ncbi:MAG TPA: hypothetical protein VLG10_12740 [Methylomirabilota bacterium]|nr:hypothetical protein [Methylomirabilota bacterium]
MVSRPLLLALALGTALAGCGSGEREWLKPDQPYTAAEFRRDMSACSSGGKVDETCMKSRGWISVSPPKPDKTAPQTPARTPVPGSRY